MVLQRRTLLARTATGIGAVAITSACGAERGAVPLSGASSSPKPSGAVPLIELAPAAAMPFTLAITVSPPEHAA